MTIWQILALVCFLVAAVLAFVGYRETPGRVGSLWAVFVSLGLAFLTLSMTTVWK